MSYVIVDVESDGPIPTGFTKHTHNPVDDARGNAGR